MLFERPIFKMLLISTSAILVEMFAMTLVAVPKGNPVQNIFSAKSTSPLSI
jgi:hypothetical protein